MKYSTERTFGAVVLRSENGRIRLTHTPTPDSPAKRSSQVRIDISDRRIPSYVRFREQVLQQRFEPVAKLVEKIAQDTPPIFIDNLFVLFGYKTSIGSIYSTKYIKYKR